MRQHGRVATDAPPDKVDAAMAQHFARHYWRPTAGTQSNGRMGRIRFLRAFRIRIGLRCTIALAVQSHALILVAAYAWFHR